ncbi:TPA: alpha/beta fold hydrolase [Providencia stuartii]|uniref:Alpha/beta hydrolase-fold protein n=2 Tax=Providencia stuartii TaxID=588 RepID=A0AAJ1JEZ7_PROST|nr:MULTISPECIES: alpha/beta fold hydrolase [Providencia]SST04437.1 putative hydrolase of alpha/beta superfamily [Acinetobacter baumannii]APG51753.1 esterase [Providencia stuartii]AVE41522.1 alpha/beta hydrolase [Providencia stuartii]AVL42017.1 alpha/beta hydrolase [Providencia stuartii]AXO19129.1 alpha/beta hydrolase [Providencia stuartii]
MINKLIISSLLFSMALTTAYARPSQTPPALDKQVSQFYDVQHHDMENPHSSKGSRTYRIFSAVPHGMQSPRPVLYMLDGNGIFPLVVNRAIQKLPKDKLPIIIGVGYPIHEAFPKQLRTYDYTPRVAGDDFAQGGGSEELSQFLTSQIRPWVEQQFAIDKQKQTLFGHSFGGLFTLMAYQKHPTAFQSFVSASPSLWWGKGTMIDKAQLTQQQNASPLFITLGELEEKPDLSRLSEEQIKHYQSRSSWITSRQLCTMLSDHGRHCEFTLYPNQSHGSVIPDAINKALDVTVQ